MEKDREFYERRFDFIVREIIEGRITLDEIAAYKGKIDNLMREYAEAYGTDSSPLSFTILQDLQ